MTSQSAGRIEGPGAEDLFDEEGEEEDAQDHPHGGAKGRAGENQDGVETATGAQSETVELDAGAGQRRGEGPDQGGEAREESRKRRNSN